MQGKTNGQLERIAKDTAFYSSERRYEALAELDRRNCLSEELTDYKKKFEESIETTKRDSEYESDKKNSYITDDPDAPLLYTKRTIEVFSLFFSVLFGSILLAINIHYHTRNKFISVLVISAGLAFTMLIAGISDNTDFSGAMLTAINGVAGVLLTEIFWNKYLGVITYRKRSVTIPLITGFVLSAIIIAAIFIS